MEDGSNGTFSDVEVTDHAKNGVVAPIMANFPDGTVAVSKEEKSALSNHVDTPKVNGENKIFEDNSYSSESDALVIDESVPKKNKRKKKTVQKTKVLEDDGESNSLSEVITHSNPFFNESIFELSQLHHNTQSEKPVTPSNGSIDKADSKLDKNCKFKQKRPKPKTKPKLREYAQYLGLQPTVQFKCSKCGRAGFESLSTLQEHVVQCNSVHNVQEELQEGTCSGFKLTRKVFLCSACGTYYENWNLYMHMLEFHRRYICLYCLGMFSVLDDLCQHIQSRHNLEPGHRNSLDEFYNVYNEPCYVVCCDCNKLFNEQDNFFHHNCVGGKNNLKNKKAFVAKPQITPENHVTGDSMQAVEPQPSNKEEKQLQITQDACDKEKDNSEKQQITDSQLVSAETSVDDKFKCQIASEQTDKKDSEREIDETSEKSCNELVSQESKMDESSDSFEGDNSKISQSNNDEVNEQEHFSESEEKLGDSYEENNFPMELDTNSREENVDRPVETRRVPKLSLKLPKLGAYPEIKAEESDDSEKFAMEVDQIESENENELNVSNVDENLDQSAEQENEEELKEEMFTKQPQYQVAGTDITIIELQLEQPLDKFEPQLLLQKCLKATVATCVYCNHARKIAVNGKQLGLHCVAEHRFSAIVNSITAEELIPETFVNRITECLDELDTVFFNLESGRSDEAVTFSHLFECFQCRFSTTVHKELYLHNRKYHSKNLLLCIMCKSNFYSYSELICHLCPGTYVLDCELTFRCCMCVNEDLPSSFRLMVHLRKRHSVCDVCLEMCHTQYRLSNHVWKHKLHHFCYRCGIAYRNKPDITRHLFWKHGTESVLCKKCLQKKWPHVYHFCVPPASFTCEECNLTLSKAVSLKVHKRLHTNEKKHACTFDGCTDGFVSKKLMLKHELRHREPQEEIVKQEESGEKLEEPNKEEEEEKKMEENVEEKVEEKPKPKIDVLDLPELNLSESDSSDSEAEATNDRSQETNLNIEAEEKVIESEIIPQEKPIENLQIEKVVEVVEETENSSSVIQNIWNNFKNYQASKEKLDIFLTETDKPGAVIDIPIPMIDELTTELALRDHDYCFDPEKKTDPTIIEVTPALTMTESVDHDYCSPKTQHTQVKESPKKEEVIARKPEKKPTNSSSSSSSGSDSSSCSCGSNCSCSSSSGSSSSSSDSSNSDSSTEEGRRKQQARRQRRKDRAKKLKKDESESKVVDVVENDQPPVIIDTPIRESDLETTESETDEEFYDKAPQKLAKKILEEKRQQLLAIMGPNSVPNGSFMESTSRPPTPPAGVVEDEPKPKKKSKSKKRKKKKSEKREQKGGYLMKKEIPIPPYYQYHQPPTVAPITLSLSRNSPAPSQLAVAPASATTVYAKVHSETPPYSRTDSTDSNLRASKRRRVPNKFYGYSSDEEDKDKVGVPSAPKWRKTELPQAPPRSPMTVPPITIKTTPQPLQQQPTVEPISIRTGAHLNDFRVQRPRPKPLLVPPIRLPRPRLPEKDSATDSNDSSSEETMPMPMQPKPNQPQLYCYCRCPYDEVSEMIGCDSNDCEIEWFHFECVGIMVPPKGQWFCPDCRKKKQQRREMLQS